MSEVLILALRLLTVAPQMIAGGAATFASWQNMRQQAKTMADENRAPTDAERAAMDAELAQWEARLHAPEDPV
jgi:hypothetical protein